MNVILIGYRGTGKSTVARLVAERLGWRWTDCDAAVAAAAGRSIREIFEQEGEIGFRAREAGALRELTGRDRTVIATGGGAVLRPDNRDAIRGAGLTVWLAARADTIERRLAGDPATAAQRPPLSASNAIDEVRHMLAQREPLYRACADLVLDTDDLPPDQIAERIVQAVHDFPSTPTE